MAFCGQVAFKSITANFNLLSPGFLMLSFQRGYLFYVIVQGSQDYNLQNAKTRKGFTNIILLHYIIYYSTIFADKTK